MRPRPAILLLGLVACGGGSSPETPSQRVLIAGVEPASGALNVDLRDTLRITFVEAIDPASPLDGCVTVVDRRGPVAVTVRLDADPTRLLVAPDRDLVLDSAVTATVSPELRTVTGAHLSSPFSWAFETRPGRWHDTGTLMSQHILGPQTNTGVAFATREDQLWALRDAQHGWQLVGTIPGTGTADSELIFLGLEDDTTLIAGLRGKTSPSNVFWQAYVRRGFGFKDWQSAQSVGASYEFGGNPSPPQIWGAKPGEFAVSTTAIKLEVFRVYYDEFMGVLGTNGTYQARNYYGGFVDGTWRLASSQHGGGRASVVSHKEGDMGKVDYLYNDTNKGGAYRGGTIASGLAREQVSGLAVIACPDGRAKVLLARSDAPGPRLECSTFQEGALVGPPATVWTGQVRDGSMELVQAQNGSAMLVFSESRPSSGDGHWVSYYDAARDTWSAPLLLGAEPETLVTGTTARIANHGDAALFVSTTSTRTGTVSLTLLRYQPGIGFRAPETIEGIPQHPQPFVLQVTLDDQGRITLFLSTRTLRYE